MPPLDFLPFFFFFKAKQVQFYSDGPVFYTSFHISV